LAVFTNFAALSAFSDIDNIIGKFGLYSMPIDSHTVGELKPPNFLKFNVRVELFKRKRRQMGKLIMFFILFLLLGFILAAED
jgi:hypothetical protein